MNKTLDQRRAAHVLEHVDKTKLTKEHQSTAESLATMIMTSGLGPTLAFLRAKGDPEKWAYQALGDWLLTHCREIPWNSVQENDLLSRLTKESSFVYRAATQEALAYVGWLKRAARAKVQDSKKVSDGKNDKR